MKLSTRHRFLFKSRSYHAVYVIAPKSLVRFQTEDQFEALVRLFEQLNSGAHNGGPLNVFDYITERWPIRIGTTGDYSEALLTQADGWASLGELEFASRIWCETAELSHFMKNDLQRNFSEVIRKNWRDGGKPMDRDLFDQNVKWLGHDNAIKGLTDLELVEELESIHQKSMTKQARGRAYHAT